jgi:hypothetical protein
MSLLPAGTCEESVWQYCNYGYDKSIYSSREDCMTGEKIRRKCGTKDEKFVSPFRKMPKPSTNQETNLRSGIKNPFAQGFKKYVVTADFLGSHLERPIQRQFKKGMNLFAKQINQVPDGAISGVAPTWVSYAGFILDGSKIAPKNPNIYEKIQNFFTVKKGFA